MNPKLKIWEHFQELVHPHYVIQISYKNVEHDAARLSGVRLVALHQDCLWQASRSVR
jgi:hypothetical protein